MNYPKCHFSLTLLKLSEALYKRRRADLKNASTNYLEIENHMREDMIIIFYEEKFFFYLSGHLHILKCTL